MDPPVHHGDLASYITKINETIPHLSALIKQLRTVTGM